MQREDDEGIADPFGDGSAGGVPQDEVTPRAKESGNEPDEAEGNALDKGSEEGPSQRRNTPIRPLNRSGFHRYEQCVRIQPEPFDESSARMICHWRARFDSETFDESSKMSSSAG